jgi:hypothetical protein
MSVLIFSFEPHVEGVHRRWPTPETLQASALRRFGARQAAY